MPVADTPTSRAPIICSMALDIGAEFRPSTLSPFSATMLNPSNTNDATIEDPPAERNGAEKKPSRQDQNNRSKQPNIGNNNATPEPTTIIFRVASNLALHKAPIIAARSKAEIPVMVGITQRPSVKNA